MMSSVSSSSSSSSSLTAPSLAVPDSERLTFLDEKAEILKHRAEQDAALKELDKKEKSVKKFSEILSADADDGEIEADAKRIALSIVQERKRLREEQAAQEETPAAKRRRSLQQKKAEREELAKETENMVSLFLQACCTFAEGGDVANFFSGVPKKWLKKACEKHGADYSGVDCAFEAAEEEVQKQQSRQLQ